ncbi:MAG: hypothetical protein V7688_01345 [Alcanivorax jadensis]|jgi:hypothetical protein|uniref:hypothetical protein n=1 Tax=Alcanivorax jadensis TaxID=64988 RepID=UPI00300231B0
MKMRIHGLLSSLTVTGVGIYSAACLSLLLSSPVLHAVNLQPLSDDEMGSVIGQEGVLLSMEYYYNSNPATDGDALLGSGAAGTFGDGGCSGQNGSSSLADMDCRLAIQLENRSDEWLVIKNGYASIVVNRLSLDASTLGESIATGAAYSSFFNQAKFEAVGGDCLLGAGNCNTGYIDNMPAVRTHYPETAGSYNPGNGTSTGYNDVRLGIYYEGMAIEFNSVPGVQDGWQQNVNGSFLGLNIADNNGAQAGIAFGGNFYMYGF